MEKTMQKYLVLFKTAAGKGGEFWEGFSKMPDEPMESIRIEESYSLFGKWDFAIIFTADSNENAIHFIGEKLRALNGIAETITSPMIVLKQHKMNR